MYRNIHTMIFFIRRMMKNERFALRVKSKELRVKGKVIQHNELQKFND
jgi:hypothetical protein